MAIADQFIRTGTYKNILVIGSEVHSRGLDKSTRGRDVTVIFGDGAGAAVLSAHEVNDPAKDSYIFSTHLHADGTGADDLCLPAAGTSMDSEVRITHAMLDEGLHFPKMNGRKVFMAAVEKMQEVLVESLSANQVRVQDVELFLFHQANLRINEAVAKNMGIPDDKVFNTIEKFANTTAATIPIGMDEALKAGKLKRGTLVALTAFGSGYTWASTLMRY